eukprot:TRINITY_DN23771_c0_g2_i2.p2 TRINITY_DN23771_c0_g2~~TRINITY_DN23771_c0_g2_i2.p2  ORF type:complete len:242 (+),score=83.00 TRINITY_DN23771_c0_g2_i2:82-726(+)
MCATDAAAAEEGRVRMELDNDIWTLSSLKLLIKEAREAIPVLRKEYEELLRSKRVRFEDGGYPAETWDETKARLAGDGPGPSTTAGPRKRAREEAPGEAEAGESDAAKRARRQARFGPLGEPPPTAPTGRGTAPARRGAAAPFGFDPHPAATPTGAPAPQQAALRQGNNDRDERGSAQPPPPPQRQRLVSLVAPSAGSDAEARRRRMQRFGTAR